MPPKGKKKAQSKEEIARLAAEAEERARREDLYRREKEAEEKMLQENDKRDKEEQRERERMKKEAEMKLLAEKNAMIASLSQQLSQSQAAFTAERNELESEVHRLRGLFDMLHNELSAQKCESEDAQRKLLEERDALVARVHQLDDNLRKTGAEVQSARGDAETKEQENAKQIAYLKAELDRVTTAKQHADRDFQFKIRSLERETEKATSLNKTLQDVIESREADDRKNVTLLQLLNNQLDENKQRHMEMLEEERVRAKQLKHDVAVLETTNSQLREETDQLKAELAHTKAQAERELADNKTKVEQLKFDTKFLASELARYKGMMAKQQEELVNAKSEAAANHKDSQLSQEAQQRKVQELEALVARKDRDNADKVAFLNAQLSNNRVIIAQLQQRLNAEREEHVAQMSQLNGEVEKNSQSAQRIHADLEKRKLAAGELEMKLNADIAILKTTVFQLQSALVDRERELESVSAAKNEEIQRLRRKLDEHFIPHRNGSAANDELAPAADNNADRVAALQKELETTSRAALETETRLKAQIANQNSMIDSMNAEIQKLRDDHAEQIRKNDQEIMRLRQILDVHNVEYRK